MSDGAILLIGWSVVALLAAGVWLLLPPMVAAVVMLCWVVAGVLGRLS